MAYGPSYAGEGYEVVVCSFDDEAFENAEGHELHSSADAGVDVDVVQADDDEAV